MIVSCNDDQRLKSTPPNIIFFTTELVIWYGHPPETDGNTETDNFTPIDFFDNANVVQCGHYEKQKALGLVSRHNLVSPSFRR